MLFRRGWPGAQILRLADLGSVHAARQSQLWDLEEGQSTEADFGGRDYNPVVLDDSVSRMGYPALNSGWGGCGGKNDLENEYPCSHPK